MSQKQYKKILIIKHGSLGDMITSIAAIKSIRDNYKNSHITILTARKYRDFIYQSKLVDEILEDSRKGFFSSLIILFRLINNKYNLIVDLQNSNRTFCYGFFFRIFSSSIINGTHSLSHLRYHYDKKKPPSVIVGLSGQINLIGCKTNNAPFFPWLEVKNISINEIKNRKYFLINPGCSRKHQQKKWPEKNYVDVCEYLLSIDIIPILIGSNEDKVTTDLISKSNNKILNLCNKSPLEVVYTLALNAKGAVSNDTGPAHLIAASGCKIHIILSSFSNPKTVIPQSENVTFSQSNNIFEISSEEIINKIKKIIK